jgi:hypothetical protein
MCYCILIKYREEGFIKSVDLAKIVALKMNVELIFPTKHRVITKKYFEENRKDHEHQSPNELFNVEYFFLLL